MALRTKSEPVFEDLRREHVRAAIGTIATRVGRWRGNSLNHRRRSGERTTEEIDVVGMTRGRVTLVGEVKWTSRPLGERTLHELAAYKIPALAQHGCNLASRLTIVLVSRSGYSEGLRARAQEDEALVLVDVEAMPSAVDRSAREEEEFVPGGLAAAARPPLRSTRALQSPLILRPGAPKAAATWHLDVLSVSNRLVPASPRTASDHAVRSEER